MARQTFTFLARAVTFTLLSLSLCPSVCSAACPTDWLQHAGFCYYFSEIKETRTLRGAALECYLHNAQLARPDTKDEIEFLQSVVKGTQGYGWIINYIYETEEEGFVYYDVIYDQFTSFAPIIGNPLVTVPIVFSTTHSCWAFHLSDFFIAKWYFDFVPCDSFIHAACQAEKQKFSYQEIDNKFWFEFNDMVYWFDYGLTTYSEANRICKTKGMKLVDNINWHTNEFIESVKSHVSDAVPFWSAARNTITGLQWDDGRGAVGKYEFDRTYDARELYKPFQKWAAVLLQSGYAHFYFTDEVWKRQNAFPYICKKHEAPEKKHGCPDLWWEGKNSCFSIMFVEKVTREEAREACQKLDSHLMRMDSPEKVEWLEIGFSKYIFGFEERKGQKWRAKPIWTEATDLTADGEFAWENGNPMDASIFPWITEAEAKNTLCSYLGLSSRYFSPTSCESPRLPACQYKLETRYFECATGWKEFNGTCYLLGESPQNMTAYHSNVAFCLSNLEGSGVEKNRITSLQVQSEDVFDFLNENFYKFGTFWVGLEYNESAAQFQWLDGATEDSYKPAEGEHCVALDPSLKAIKTTCETELAYVCEKDLPPKRNISFDITEYDSKRNTSDSSDSENGEIFAGVDALSPSLVCCLYITLFGFFIW